uniref:Uncharacterized protein n=1 Tax=Anguilla anguilla TaxID=7936 RepID=A0A0E9PHZ7_ANGAN
MILNISSSEEKKEKRGKVLILISDSHTIPSNSCIFPFTNFNLAQHNFHCNQSYNPESYHF